MIVSHIHDFALTALDVFDTFPKQVDLTLLFRTDKFEFGNPEWKFAIKLIYKDLLQEKR